MQASDLSPASSERLSPRALALVGMAGSGKSLCAAHLQMRGYFQFRFGSIVVDEVIRRGLPIAPQHERAVREEFRTHEGMDAIARRALPILRDGLNTYRTIIIDGVYSHSEYKLLVGELGAPMVVVAVVCDRAVRYSRLANRADRPLTAAEAETRDYAEIEYLEKGGPIALADYTLTNNDPPAALTAALDALLARLELMP